MDTNDRLKRLLKERGWTEYRLSKNSGLAETTIGNIFRRNTVPSIPTLEIICKSFGITLAQFFAEGDTGLREDRNKYYTKLPVYTGGNVYFNGAKPCDKEVNYREDTEHEIYIKLVERNGQVLLDTNLYEFLPEFETGMVSTELLGEAFEPEERFENPDGSEIVFDRDYFGDPRGVNPLAGPFAKKDSVEKSLT